MTSANISARSKLCVMTNTESLSFTFNWYACTGVMCIWRFATITPWSNSTLPHGPTSVHPGVPAVSPDWRIIPGIPSFLESVIEISTWVSPRKGPRTATLSNAPFGPRTSRRSSQANCPGWLSSDLNVSSFPSPNNISKSSRHRWMCLALVSIGIASPMPLPHFPNS